MVSLFSDRDAHATTATAIVKYLPEVRDTGTFKVA
jgi:hypothetical protein